MEMLRAGRRKPSTPVTLKDVGRRAGVSYQTVSRAINGYPEIKPETRERVLRVARQLRYRPNRLAGSLRTNRSHAIGLIMSDVENVFFAEVVSGVEAEASLRGYSVILANSGEDIGRERRAVAALMERRVDGLIIAPAEGNHRYLAAELPRGFPAIAINRMIEGLRCGAALVDNEAGAYTATQYLIRQGHSRIGAVIGSRGLMTSRERLAGFQAAVRDHGLTLRPEWVRFGGVRPEGGRLATLEIFKAPEPPTALFASSNKLAEGALRALKELGLRMGHDVGIVGFDYVSWARLLDPPLPVVAQPTYEIGRRAVGLLLDMIGGVAREPRIIRLPTRLLVDGVREAFETIDAHVNARS